MQAIGKKDLELSELEKNLLLDANKHCTADDCVSPALVVLGQKPLCLKHFLIRCYQWLDHLDPMVRGRLCAPSELARVQSMVEECSNRALLVSLRYEDLSNLDRSRLLDILLLTSDLLFILRVPRSEPPSLLAFHPKSEKRSVFSGVTRDKLVSSRG